MSLSIILPAHNEAAYITSCLLALLASEGAPGQVIVVANGCSDDTADRARAMAPQFTAQGWRFEVFETAEGGKLNALNLGDRLATGTQLIYLDADVTVSPGVIPALSAALETNAPRYACASPRLSLAQSRITRAYGRLWRTLPFLTQGTPGFGIFAMTRAGRARWDAWPNIISDDTFARLQFRPDERVRVNADYSWPMVEGFTNLVRVRRRQNRGVAEIAARYPELIANEDTPRVGVEGALHRAQRDPVGFAVYMAVTLAVKTPLFASKSAWARGR